MAGTLTISTLSDGTNSTSATNPIRGSAKAWAYFNGSTAAINGSYNVTSITRNSTGDYTLAFTTAMSNANYALTGVAGSGNTTNGSVCSNYNVASPTTSAVRFQVTNSGNVVDLTYVSVAIFN